MQDRAATAADQYLKLELVSVWQKVASSHEALDHLLLMSVFVPGGVVQCFRPVDGLAEGEAACC